MLGNQAKLLLLCSAAVLSRALVPTSTEGKKKLAVYQFKMSSFFFTKIPPEEQMYTDIKSLNKFDEKAFCQLVDIVFSFLVSPKEGTRFMSQVSEFAGEHGVSTNALKNVVKSLLGFFKSALKSNLTPAQVKEDLEHLGKTDREKHRKIELGSGPWGRGVDMGSFCDKQPTLIHITSDFNATLSAQLLSLVFILKNYCQHCQFHQRFGSAVVEITHHTHSGW